MDKGYELGFGASAPAATTTSRPAWLFSGCNRGFLEQQRRQERRMLQVTSGEWWAPGGTGFLRESKRAAGFRSHLGVQPAPSFWAP